MYHRQLLGSQRVKKSVTKSDTLFVTYFKCPSLSLSSPCQLSSHAKCQACNIFVYNLANVHYEKSLWISVISVCMMYVISILTIIAEIKDYELEANCV